MISYGKDFGGAELCSYSLAKEFSDENNSDLFICSERKFPSIDKVKWIKKRVLTLLRFLFLNRKNIEYVFLVNTLSAIYSPFLKLMGFKLIYLMHDDYSMQTRKRKVCYRIGQFYSDIVVFPSKYSYSAVDHICRGNRHIIYNKIKLKREKVRIPDLNLEIKVLNVGRIERNKNQLLALKILSEVKRITSLFDIGVCFLGQVTDIEYKNELILFAEENNIKIRFDVSKPDRVKSFYLQSDLVIHSSNIECLPTIVIESIINGVIVFSTDVGGTREIISDEFLLKPHSVKENADKISGFLLKIRDSKNNDLLDKSLTELQSLTISNFSNIASGKILSEIVQR